MTLEIVLWQLVHESGSHFSHSTSDIMITALKVCLRGLWTSLSSLVWTLFQEAVVCTTVGDRGISRNSGVW